MTEQLEAATPHKRKRITRNPKRKRRQFEDADDATTEIIGPGSDPKP